MTHPLYQSYHQQLAQLQQQGNLRGFKSSQQQGQWISVHQHKMFNLSSNDYLALAQNQQLKQQFFDEHPIAQLHLTSSSSRLLTGNFAEYEQLEDSLNRAYQRASLVFNSGYHMNIGILPALSDAHSLIISDELIHASMIDGIRLSKAQRQRFKHQDLAELEQIIQQAQQNADIDKIFIVVESIYSMDGDVTDLTALVKLKQQYNKVLLYVDEAHAVGVRGQRGLGCAEEMKCLAEIDFLVGTFGKALASVGGFLICAPIIREFLINRMRSLIFTTAQAPISMAWSRFTFETMQTMQQQRTHLQQLGQWLKQVAQEKGFVCPSQSHIVPIIYGENQKVLDQAASIQQQGFYVLPIRPPTVPAHQSRLRVCLHAGLEQEQLQPLLGLI